MAKKSLVALVKGTDIQENVTKVFDLMGGVENVIRKGSTVVLKPNAGLQSHLRHLYVRTRK